MIGIWYPSYVFFFFIVLLCFDSIVYVTYSLMEPTVNRKRIWIKNRRQVNHQIKQELEDREIHQEIAPTQNC